MLNWFLNFQIEKISFFIGFLTALVLIFVFQKSKKYFPDVKNFFFGMTYLFQKNKLSNIKNNVLKEAYIRAQSNHLAKELFFLDELVIEPTFLIEPKINLDENTNIQSEISSTIPFIPDFSTLSRNFNLSRLAIKDLVKSDSNLVLYGLPGSGKSISLSLIVSHLIIQSDDNVNHKKTPFFFSAMDIQDDYQFISSEEFISTHLCTKIQSISSKDLRKFIRSEIDLNSCVLAIDDLDNLHPEKFDKIADLLEKITTEKPNLQVIITCSPFYVGNIIKNGFTPIFISSWSNAQIQDYYNKWNLMWKKINNQSDQTNLSDVVLIKSWTTFNLSPMTPLEHTLFIWGAYAGDLPGNDLISLVGSYINRVWPIEKQKQKITNLALNCLNNRSQKFNSGLRPEELEPLLNSGLISKISDSEFAFQHAQIFAYLAHLSDDLKFHPHEIDHVWPVALAYFGYSSNLPNQLLDENKTSDSIPKILLFIHQISFVIKNSHLNSKFQNELIKQLINKIQNRNILLPIRLRALVGLIQSNNPNISFFIRQLLSKNELDYTLLSLFGIGCSTHDLSLLQEVIKTTKSVTFEIKRLAYLVLTTFSEEQAIHELGKALLNEHEKIRHLIAESFAIENTQGEEILMDAISLEDIIVRRAAISGLIKLNNEWARKTLKRLAVEDEQWVIRNASLQAMEFLQDNQQIIIDRVKPIQQNPWLIKFAGKQNLGVSPGKSNVKSLLIALASEDHHDLQNAIKLSIFDHNQELLDKMISILKISRDDQITNQIILTLLLIQTSNDVILVGN